MSAKRDLAVFLRGVNVGKRVLKTVEFAAALSPLQVASVGAAGTFAVSSAPPEATLRTEFARRLPFPAEMAIVPRPALRRLLDAGGSDAGGSAAPARRSVTLLVGAPGAIPTLPVERPVGEPWEVRLTEYRHPFVIGAHWRRHPDRVLYPNEIVEREFGVAATTRWWETLEKVEAAFAAVATAPLKRPSGRPGAGSGSPGPARRGPAPSGRRRRPRTS